MTTNRTISPCPSAVEIGSYPIAEFMERKHELLKAGNTVYDFGPGDDTLPVPEIVLQAVREHLSSESRYPLVRGFAELRSAIASYLDRRFQVSVSEKAIIPVTGSKEGIYHLPALLIDAHSTRRKVLGPALAYPPYIKGTLAVNGEYVPIQGGADEEYLLELGELPPALLNDAAIVYLNYPHNPTGSGCTLDYLKRQAEIAAQYGILLVSDECYADIFFDSPPPSILQVAQEGVLAFHSLSKRSGLTGYRSGFVAGDSKLVDAYARMRNSIGTAPPEMIMHASVAAWNDDHHVQSRREALRPIRERFIAFFNELGLEYLKTDATFYLWAKAPEGHSGMSYAQSLREKGIFISPSSFFGSGSDEWFRVSLVLSLQDCENAFQIWRTV